MKAIVSVLVFLTVIAQVPGRAQGGTWVWMAGGAGFQGGYQDTAVYGIKGVPGANNTPPGLYEAPDWIDQDGNLWLLGGEGGWGGNDLWKYDVTLNMWAWVNGPGHAGNVAGTYGTLGVPSAANVPAARGFASVSWTDNNGDFWLFGGQDVSGTDNLNDLWRYNIASNEWTWMSGSPVPGQSGDFGTILVPAPTNVPPGKRECNSGWVDCNNQLWLFGGVTVSFCNDMWRYDVSSNIWTWMKGDSTGATSHYGIKGVETAANLPTPRMSYTRWQDTAGNFYIWGGDAFGNRTDVWRFNPFTNNWTWIAGDTALEDTGSYLNYCVDAGEPMARFENRTAQVPGGSNVFVGYGGSNSPFSFSATLDDLWTFNPQTLQWKCLSGTNIPDNTLHGFGTQGVPAAGNLPYGRMGHCMWIDNTGIIWVCGGVVGAQFATQTNDLWKFIPDTICLDGPLSGTGGSYYQLPRRSICNGDSSLLSLIHMGQVQISPASSLTWIDSAHVYLHPDTTTTYIITGSAVCSGNYNQAVTLTVASPVVSITGSGSSICPGDSIQFCASPGFASYTWNNTQTAPCMEASQAGNYRVSVADIYGCTAVSNSLPLTIKNSPPVSISINNDTLQVYNSVKRQWYLNGNILIGDTGRVLIATAPGNYTVQVTDSDGCSTQSAGQMIVLGVNGLQPDRVMLYPNPTANTCTLQLTGSGSQYTAAIFDITGREVLPLFLHQQISTYTFSTGGLSAGSYFVQVSNEQGMNVTAKLVKE